ncbi:MAG TPA: 3,4-dihydroxy-2-butanone-4-phosphate synthase, partial [Prolixibacteraceae bacterium]|nr:3,4-dihydroxy-2-butanone-4-phosphate synthase [Prolixibacteraceae bacterium]
MDEIKLNSIQEAIAAIKNGELVIVVDDEDRENEGDFIVASELLTPEIINFMTIQGRGLICVALTEKRCEELKLDLMVGKNTSHLETQFTVSVDAIHPEVTTGISAKDRAITIQKLVNSKTKPEELGRPGHVFPLKAKNRGVLRRSGHTEAAVDLARLAGLYPSGVLVEIMNEDGTMARLPELYKLAQKFNLKIITIKDLISFLFQSESLIERGEEVNM